MFQKATAIRFQSHQFDDLIFQALLDCSEHPGVSEMKRPRPWGDGEFLAHLQELPAQPWDDLGTEQTPPRCRFLASSLCSIPSRLASLEATFHKVCKIWNSPTLLQQQVCYSTLWETETLLNHRNLVWKGQRSLTIKVKAGVSNDGGRCKASVKH